MATTVYILSGSNLGDRERNLNQAVSLMEAVPGLEIIATSGLYVSDAWEMEGENPSFLNQAIMADYLYRPAELMGELERAERSMGRTDKGRRLPRTIDLDILLFGDEIIKTEGLTIPHPELLRRPFAMIPLLQLDPELEHPEKHRKIAGFVSEADYRKVLLFKDHVERQV